MTPSAPLWLCLFDLDRTLLRGRTIEHLARRFGLTTKLRGIFDSPGETGASRVQSEAIMALFEGVAVQDFDAACRDVPLAPGLPRLGPRLEALGCVPAIATASYRPAADRPAAALGATLVAALEPEAEKGLLTGRYRPTRWTGDCGRPICKAEVLRALADETGAVGTMAVGDGVNDLCMFEAADVSVAVHGAHPDALRAADHGPVALGEIPSILERHVLDAPPAAHDAPSPAGRS